MPEFYHVTRRGENFEEGITLEHPPNRMDVANMPGMSSENDLYEDNWFSRHGKAFYSRSYLIHHMVPMSKIDVFTERRY